MATTKTYNSVKSKEQLMLVEISKGTFGGYKQELLVNSLNEIETEFYVCAICNGVMRNACQEGDGNILVCEACVKNNMSHPMMKARQRIQELKVNCPLLTYGCIWNATLSEVEKHLDACQEFQVKCEYECGVILKRCEMNNHSSNECLNRIVLCEQCQNEIVNRELKQHCEGCLEFALLCPNKCGNNLSRKQTHSHIETDCPNTIVKCCYERFGCKEVFKRCEMEEHNRTNETKHLKMTTLFAVDEMGRLKETMRKQFSQMNNMIEEQSITINKQSAIIESLSYPLVFRNRIKQRDVFKERSFIDQLFTLAKFEISWRFLNLLLIFGNSSEETIPVTIVMKYHPVMSKLAGWPFEGRFKLTIADRVDTNNSLVYESNIEKLKPDQFGFISREEYPDRFELATIPKSFLLEDRFITEEGEIGITLHVQEAEHFRILGHTTQKKSSNLSTQ